MATKKDSALSLRLQGNITYLRESEGLSMTELAKVLGCNRADVGNWESRYSPKLPDLVMLSDYFKVSIDDLVRKDLTKITLLPKSIRTSEAIKEEEIIKKGDFIKLLRKYVEVLEKTR